MASKLIYADGESFSVCFEDRGHQIEAFYSSEFGFENVMVDTELVDSLINPSTGSSIKFAIRSDEYLICISNEDPPEASFIEEVYVDGKLVSSRINSAFDMPNNNSEIEEPNPDNNWEPGQKEWALEFSLLKNGSEIQRQKIVLQTIQVISGPLYLPGTTGFLALLAFMSGIGCLYLEAPDEFYYLFFGITVFLILLNIYGFFFGDSIQIIDRTKNS